MNPAFTITSLDLLNQNPTWILETYYSTKGWVDYYITKENVVVSYEDRMLSTYGCYPTMIWGKMVLSKFQAILRHTGEKFPCCIPNVYSATPETEHKENDR